MCRGANALGVESDQALLQGQELKTFYIFEYQTTHSEEEFSLDTLTLFMALDSNNNELLTA